MEGLLNTGDEVKSPKGNFTYRVVGPVCRLYDRDDLPWPSCRLSWHGKQPSWNRVGKRFVPDLATTRAPSYAVELLGDYSDLAAILDEHLPKVITLYYLSLPPTLQEWWVTPSCKLKHYVNEIPTDAT